MSSDWSRREAIKVISLACVPVSLSSWAVNDNGEPIILPDDNHFFHQKLSRPLTVITLGAGARGNVYGDYAIEFPDQLNIIGVAEPMAIRNEVFSKKHNIPEANRFNTWEDVFKRPKFADAIIISTPDNLHYGPCMAALKMGYDVLLEKPISPSEQECRDIMELTKKTGRIVAVCHVLRYAPYFIRLKELIQSGAIGEVISLQHLEPIEHVHMSHSYVRGNWRKADESTPIILAKSCHDLDIIKWILDKQSKKIQAFGNLNWFTKKNAPKGSTNRCTDGCTAENTCPYSAIKIYHQNRERTYVFELPEEKQKHPDAIMEYLKTTDYGRCVYRMDNDQPDHYTTNILFDNNVTASFSMEAFTPWAGRRTRIMGSHGFIEGDMTQFTVHNFATGQSKKFESKTSDVANYRNEGHGGGDWRLVANWIHAVAEQDPSLLTSTIDNSIESHVMGFAAEKSRKENSVVDIIM